MALHSYYKYVYTAVRPTLVSPRKTQGCVPSSSPVQASRRMRSEYWPWMSDTIRAGAAYGSQAGGRAGTIEWNGAVVDAGRSRAMPRSKRALAG